MRGKMKKIFETIKKFFSFVFIIFNKKFIL